MAVRRSWRLPLLQVWSGMPLILIFGQIRGAYLGGSILAFFLGYSMLFFKGGVLSSLYPFSAALVLAGFDLSGYAGTTAAPDMGLAAAGVGVRSSGQECCFCGSRKKKEMRPRRRPVPGGRREGLRRCKGLRPWFPEAFSGPLAVPVHMFQFFHLDIQNKCSYNKNRTYVLF